MAITTIGGAINSTAVLPNLDYKYGPYNSLQEAYNNLGPSGIDKLTIGLTVGIIENGEIIEYWFKNGIEFNNLVRKSDNSVSDYVELSNKPKINNIEINGDLTSEDLGLVNSITIGTTTTGAAGSNASVTNSGTSTALVLDFTIPRGAVAVNPFKGWFNAVVTGEAGSRVITSETQNLPENPSVGDYAYVKTWEISGTAPDQVETPITKVYECSVAGTWSDSGMTADTSNVQTFASGEEVNEVGIVDVHTSTSTKNVLSANQGSELWGFLTNEYEAIDLSRSGNQINYIINNSGQWSSSNSGYILMVSPNKKYKIRANINQNTNIAVLKDNNFSSFVQGGTPVFSDYFPLRMTILKGDWLDITIPSDATCIFIQTTASSGSVSTVPSIICTYDYTKDTLNKIIPNDNRPLNSDALCDILYHPVSEFNVVENSIDSLSNYFLSPNRNTLVLSNGAIAYFTKVEPGTIFKITANSSNTACVSFVNSANIIHTNRLDLFENTIAPIIPKGTSKFIRVPDGCSLMFVQTTRYNVNDFLPRIDVCEVSFGGSTSEEKFVNVVGNGITGSNTTRVVLDLEQNEIYDFWFEKKSWDMFDSVTPSHIAFAFVVLSQDETQSFGTVFKCTWKDMPITDKITLGTFNNTKLRLSFVASSGFSNRLFFKKVTNKYHKNSNPLVFETINSELVSYIIKVDRGDAITYNIESTNGTTFMKVYEKNRVDPASIIDSITATADGYQRGVYFFNKTGYLQLTSSANSSPSVEILARDALTKNFYLPDQIKFHSSLKNSIISPSDNSATQYDNYRCCMGDIVKIDGKYVMLYNAAGIDNTNLYRICMAYSDDGVTYTRGLPAGYEAPYIGTNIIIDIGTQQNPIVGEYVNEFVNEFCITIVEDVYKYRMIANIRNYNNSTTKSCVWMLKSNDLVNWIPVRRLFNGLYDNYPSAIYIGNGLIKVYLRIWDYDNTAVVEQRTIGMAIIDIDGNVIVPNSLFFGKGLYCAAATKIGDNRELWLPSRFYKIENVTVGDGTVESYINENGHVRPIATSGLDTMTNLDDGWRLVRGIYSNGNNIYCLYTQFEKKHGETNNRTSIMICPIEWKTYGSPNNLFNP